MSEKNLSACALAAAHAVMFPDQAGNYDEARMLAAFPIIGKTSKYPCECHKGNEDKVGNIIMHVNDRHQWDREKTARWVEGLEEAECKIGEKAVGQAEKLVNSMFASPKGAAGVEKVVKQ